MLPAFANARARPTRLDALADLIGAEPELELAVTRIVELARRETAPLATHLVGRAQVTTVPRSDAATWVARMFLGAVEPPTGLGLGTVGALYARLIAAARGGTALYRTLLENPR